MYTMDFLWDFITNRFVIIAMSSWAIAQVVKMILYVIVTKSWDFNRLVGDGGMPSGHSATVTSLATSIGLALGFGSVEFAIAGVLAVIVCHDAMGVRLETGKQTMLLNELVKSFEILTSEQLPEVKLKEFVGHTPVQVLAGILLGIGNALILHHFVL